MPTIKMDDNGYKFEDLEDKYSDFISPICQVVIKGKSLLMEHIAVSKVIVETSVSEEADSFSFSVVNAYDLVKRDFYEWANDYFTLGEKVEIKMGYLDKLSTVFYGLITAVNYSYYDEETPTIEVKGMDFSFLLMKGLKTAQFKDMSYADVVKKIVKNHGLKSEVDSTGGNIPFIEQHNISDYHFIQSLATKNNFDFFVVGDKVYFRKALKDKTPVMTLFYGKSLKGISIEADISQQISEVIVRSWDSKKQAHIEHTESQVNKLGSNSKTGVDLMKKVGKDNKHYILTNVSSLEEAKNLAKSVLNHQAMKLITGYGQSIGLPELRAGKYIKFDGLGEKLNQVYYLTSVTHTVDESGYNVDFSVGGNAI